MATATAPPPGEQETRKKPISGIIVKTEVAHLPYNSSTLHTVGRTEERRTEFDATITLLTTFNKVNCVHAPTILIEDCNLSGPKKVIRFEGEGETSCDITNIKFKRCIRLSITGAPDEMENLLGIVGVLVKYREASNAQIIAMFSALFKEDKSYQNESLKWYSATGLILCLLVHYGLIEQKDSFVFRLLVQFGYDLNGHLEATRILTALEKSKGSKDKKTDFFHAWTER
ncbi:MAG: hypothetical protein WC045_01660 [Patescibacteria group bacterium]